MTEVAPSNTSQLPHPSIPRVDFVSNVDEFVKKFNSADDAIAQMQEQYK
jgi:hypothetical protein